jgi:hypothetical protein
MHLIFFFNQSQSFNFCSFRKYGPILYRKALSKLVALVKDEGEASVTMDAGTDNCGEPCMIWTIQRKCGEVSLWHIAYSHMSMDSPLLISLTNELVMGSLGSFQHIDVFFTDCISYHLAAYSVLRSVAPQTLFLIDSCHSFDALLEVGLSGFDELLNVVSAVKAAFRSNYKTYVAQWIDHCKVGDNSVFAKLPPSSTNTRAWAGNCHVIEWMFNVFLLLGSFLSKCNILDQLSKSMSFTVEAEAMHLKGAQQLARLFDQDCDLIYVSIVVALALTQPAIEGIMSGQTRYISSIQCVFSLYCQYRAHYVDNSVAAINITGGVFEELLQELDELLLDLYKALDPSSKSQIKRSVCASATATHDLIVKNGVHQFQRLCRMVWVSRRWFSTLNQKVIATTSKQCLFFLLHR